MNFNPYCPNCGKEIEFLEHYDLSDEGGYYYCLCNRTM